MQPTQFPTTLFLFSEYWWFYLIFICFIFVVLFLDLGFFNRKSHAINVKESLIWSVIWFIFAMAFNLLFYFFSKEKATLWYMNHPWSIPQGITAQIAGAVEGKKYALEFLTGYIIEKVLAVDNIFVFVMIFKFLNVPLKYQHKVLFFGILGALLFRAIFISIGAALVEFDWVLILFGGFLILTGIKLLFMPESKSDLNESFIMRFFKKTDRVSGKSFSEIQGRFIIRENNKIYITTLFLTLILIEFSDIVFALDSVPAIFAITREPLIVFTSNIFAILGLRSLYFLLANMVEKFEYLKYGISIILIFIGVKMAWLNHEYDDAFPISYSLIFIFLVLLICTIASLVKMKAKEGT